MTQPTLVSWVLEHARRTPHAAAVDSPDYRLTYRMLAERVLALAAALRERGIRPGDRVLSALPNLPAAVVVSLAVQHVGAVSVEVSRDWSAEQVAFVLAQAEVDMVAFAGRDARKFAPLCEAAGVRSALLVHPSEPPAPLRALLSKLSLTHVDDTGKLSEGAAPFDELPAAGEVDPNEVTLLLYTSGSTGQPRAVMQTVGNIAANTRSIVQYLGLGAQDRAMLILPLSYCYGRSVLQTHLSVGASVFLDTRFMYPRTVLDAIGSEGCTGFAGVPLTFELLRRQTEPKRESMASLRYVTQAGGRMERETIAWVRTAFAPAELYVMYGQTEATARISYLPPARAEEKVGSIGVPVEGVELRVVDDDDADLPPGTHGQLVARGPSITPGYYKAPDETAQLLRGGWLRTGDLGYVDEDGYFFLVGRAKEILKVGGHRVSPGDIEAEIAAHPAVLEAAVAGLPDELLGEVPGALVVLREGAALDERELRKFLGERVRPFMMPRVIHFVAELPRNASGKLARALVIDALKGLSPSGDNRG